jgi:hypothetical protein
MEAAMPSRSTGFEGALKVTLDLVEEGGGDGIQIITNADLLIEPDQLRAEYPFEFSYAGLNAQLFIYLPHPSHG